MNGKIILFVWLQMLNKSKYKPGPKNLFCCSASVNIFILIKRKPTCFMDTTKKSLKKYI